MNNNAKYDLSYWGYSRYFEPEKSKSDLSGHKPSRVIAEYKEAYKVISATGEYLARITGKLIFKARKRKDYPAVGDWVAISELSEKRAVIHKVFPRKTVLNKQYSNKQDAQIIATNVDVVFIVESLDRDYNLNRFERYLVLVKEGGIKPIIILNKTDLVSKSKLKSKLAQVNKRFSNVDVISTSTLTDQGLEELSNCIKTGKTYCFLGSSGVGKSSLINKLLGKDEIKTREINTITERGRHTTSVREMYLLKNGGTVIDNPGTREVGIVNSDTGITNVFDEIGKLANQCKYSNCTHIHEPGCAVLKAIEDKIIDKEKYTNYIKLKKESDYYKMTNLEKKKKDRKFGQFIKKAQDDLKDI